MKFRFDVVVVRRKKWLEGKLVEVAETYYENCTAKQACAYFDRRKMGNGYAPAEIVRCDYGMLTCAIAEDE